MLKFSDKEFKITVSYIKVANEKMKAVYKDKIKNKTK